MPRWILTATLLCACVPDDGSPVERPDRVDTALDPCPPAVEIGTGDEQWEDIATDAPLTMIHGPQGGWHMLASVRIGGAAPEVHVRYQILHPASGTLVSNNSYNLALAMEDDCEGTYSGMYGYLDVTALEDGELNTPPELLAGESLVIRMEVDDALGHAATAEKTVTAVADPKDL